MNPLIQFFSEEVSFKLGQEKDIHALILKIIESEGLSPGVINYILCNDEYLLELNQKFLDRDTLTDVIAFDYSDNEGEVSGDVFISIERTVYNADAFDQPHEIEVLRVIVHGTLHLCGYKDYNADEKAIMTDKEDKYLSLLPS